MDGKRRTAVPAGREVRPDARRGVRSSGRQLVAAYLVADMVRGAMPSLSVQSLVLVAAVFGILAISLDLVAGMLGLYSLGQGGFFAIGAYLTTIVADNLELNVFAAASPRARFAGAVGVAIGAMSLRVSGLYFAITTFIFTLVLTVLATDLRSRAERRACSARPSRLSGGLDRARCAGRLVRHAGVAGCAASSGTSAIRPSIPCCCRSGMPSASRKPPACAHR